MSKPVFLVMPQWQGSASSRAMQIADGAAALREDLPASATREVRVPLEAGDAMGTPIARLSSLIAARDAALEAIAELEGPHIMLGGDRATAAPAIEAAVRRHGEHEVAVLWFDAYPALQDPSTSPSGAAAGMALRHALGIGHGDLVSRFPAAADRLALVGVRAGDPEEEIESERLKLDRLDHPVAEDPEEFSHRVVERVRATGASRVFVHVGLEVLDPSEFAAVHAAIPFGLGLSHLTASIRAALAALPLAGATITEFAPADEAAAVDAMPHVLRILGALTSGIGPTAGAAE